MSRFDDLRIFGGTGNQALTGAICSYVGVRQAGIKVVGDGDVGQRRAAGVRHFHLELHFLADLHAGRGTRLHGEGGGEEEEDREPPFVAGVDRLGWSALVIERRVGGLGHRC